MCMYLCVYIYIYIYMHVCIYIYAYIHIHIYIDTHKTSAGLYTFLGRTLEAPFPKMSGLVKKISPFSKRTNPL